MHSHASSFTFPEVISLKPSLLPLLFRQSHRVPAVLKYLRGLFKGSQTFTTLSVLYYPTAPDSKGRLYPRTTGAQKLPRSFRSLLFGNTHTEIDLVGSHYQLFQRLAFQHLNVVLPGVQALRFMIQADIDSLPSSTLPALTTAQKDLPTILLNSAGGHSWSLSPIRLLAFPQCPGCSTGHLPLLLTGMPPPFWDSLTPWTLKSHRVTRRTPPLTLPSLLALPSPCPPLQSLRLRACPPSCCPFRYSRSAFGFSTHAVQ